MRNLKRALSLAMASIMILGLMVTGAAAVSNGDFSDQDKIVNKEAVSVLTTLNVINGRDDGSYDPAGIVTRGEMAKMICVILNGGKDPQLGETVKNSYTDTATHWAKAYIEYCTTLGIVAGRNDGSFDPNGSVTVAEAGKMLLVALGYNAAVEGYTGGNWQINTDVRANQKGLYDGIGTNNTSTPLTRDNAAQICYNALDVKMVQYSYVITGTADNSIATKPQIDDSKLGSLLYEKFNVVKVEGIVVGNEYATLSSSKTNTDYATKGQVIGSAQDAGKTVVKVTNGDDQNKYTGTQTFNVASGLDVLGRNVALFVKIESSASKAQVIGSAIVSEDNKVVTDYTGDKIADVADDNDMELVSSTMYAFNYGNETKVLADAEKAVKTGVEKILIDADNDNKVDYVLLNTYQLGKVASVSTKDKGSINVTLNSAEGAFKMDNSSKVVGFDDVKKDDMVLTAFIGGKLHVEVAEMLTGKIEAYKLNTKSEYTTGLTVDGTVYTVSRVPTIEVNDITAAQNLADKTIIDSSATFYLDKQGAIIAQGEVKETAYNYAFVWATNTKDPVDGNRVKVTLSDGTTGAYNLHTDSVTPDEMGIYAYTLNSAGTTIKLLNATGGAVSGTTPVFEKGKSTVKITDATVEYQNNSKQDPSTTGNYYANNSTVFFYVTMDSNTPANVKKVTTYAGRNAAPSLNKTDDTNPAYVALGRSDVGAVAFTGVSSKESAGDHLFLYSAGRVYNDYTEAKVFLKGSADVSDIKVSSYDNNAISQNGTLKDGLYLYSIDSDGYYELTTPTMDTKDFYVAGQVTRTYSNSIVLDKADVNNTGVNEFVITKDTIVIDNTDNPSTPTAIANGSIAKGDKVALLENSDNQVYMIVIDNTTGSTTPSTPTGAFDGTNRLSISKDVVDIDYYSTISTAEVARLVKAADASISSVDATSLTSAPFAGESITVTYSNGDKVKMPIGTVTEYFKLTTGSDVTGSYKVDTKDYTVSNNMAYLADGTSVDFKTASADAIIEVTNANDVTGGTDATGTKTTAHTHPITADMWVYAASQVNMAAADGTVMAGTTAIADGGYVKVGTVLTVTSTSTTADDQIKADANFIGTKADDTDPATATYTVTKDDVTFTVANNP